MKNEKREYRISMDSLTAIVVMQSLDVIVSGLDDPEESKMLMDVGGQIDHEHTRFLNDPINVEKDMNTERKPIDDAVDQIKHGQLITGIAFQIIEEADKTSLPESMLIEQVEVRMRELISERMERKVNKG